MPISHPAPERFLTAGCTFSEYLPAGTLVLCTDGCLTLHLPAIDLAESALRPTLRLEAGETCQLETAGWVAGSAPRTAALRVLRPETAPAQLARLLARVTRRLAHLRHHRTVDESVTSHG